MGTCGQKTMATAVPACDSAAMMKPLRPLALGAFATALAIGAAAANEEAVGLPGVEQGHGIVKVAPPPEPDDTSRAAGSGLQVNGWDIRIGGTITYDIGIGNLPPPRH